MSADIDFEAIDSKYRDIVDAETSFNNQAPPASVFTEDEQQSLCSVLQSVNYLGYALAVVRC